MPKSLLEQLPEIVANGRREAERILEGLEGRHRIGLQTREWVLPSRDSSATDWVTQDVKRTSEEGTSPSAWNNRLIYGDNLMAMAALLAGDHASPSLRGAIDLIYVDPPFDSKADYRTRISLPGIQVEQRPTVIEQFAYSDTWANGTASYLEMITPRLILMREMLSDTGSIFVHLDWHVGHYVKIVMDNIFGSKNFTNEIVWWYYNKMQGNVNCFPRNHDVLLYYRKGPDFTFTSQKELRPAPVQQIKRVWSKEKGAIVNAKDADGRVLYQESTHRTIDDVWRLSMLQPADKTQNLRFDTQKPESILERVISATTDPGDLVADFNGGSGTTAAVAERLGRRWITTDLGKHACMIIRKRLIDQDAKPFLYQAVGDYHVEAAKANMGRDFRIGDLAQIVLSLYGAIPLPVEDNASRNLGQISGITNALGRGSKTLVLADSPNKLTGVATLKRAVALRDSLLGGWDRVVVLGWNFEPSIGETLTAMDDRRLEVLVIPPDLLDRLKKKGGVDKLRGQVRFSSLQYLTIRGALREETTPTDDGAPQETLAVALKNYVLLSPEAINLDEDNRLKLQAVANADPLALIEYWAIDPDYDGQLFRSVWQDYRGNTANDGDEFRVVTSAKLTLPRQSGPRRVCVRAVDVFGFESEVIATVAEAKA
jgi:adenine-specific DNA-methyltransferase